MPETELARSSPEPLKLLVSARDPAAALQMAAICAAAARDPRFDLAVVAQEPASRMLIDAGITVHALPPVLSRHPSGENAEKLLSLADDLLQSHAPDVVLCGLSSPGEAGIDEALMARRRVPGLLLQDFWGEQNNFFGASPDLALVLDATAAEQTRMRHGTPSRVTGSARHSTYSGFDSAAARRLGRASLAAPLGPHHTVLGLFGQPLHMYDGYRRTLQEWVQAAQALPGPTTIIYRPHPRETLEGRAWTERWLVASGIPSETLDAGSTEQALSVCDVACSVLSNCAYDGAYLNYFSAEPLVVPLLLLFDAELQAFYGKTIDFRRLPYVQQSLAHAAWQKQDVPPLLAWSITAAARQKVWKAAKEVLPNPSEAIELVLRETWAAGASAKKRRG